MFIKNHLIRIIRKNDNLKINNNKFIRLNKNEFTGEFSKKFLENIKKKITSENLSIYPNLSMLYSYLSDFLQVNYDNLLITSGSDLAIKTVFETYIGVNDKVLIHSPGYAMSSIYADLFGSKKEIISINNFSEDLIKKISNKIDDNYKLIIIENPNGFTGQPVDLISLKKLIKVCLKNNIIVLLDEAYFEYNDNKSLIKYITKYPNLIISRSFSKGLSLAGIRMGYLLSSKIRISELSKFKPLHEISSLTNLVALESVKNIKFMVNIQKQVLKNKKYFLSRINNFFETIDTKTNFILIRIPNTITSKELINYYYLNKILIREPFELGILKDYIRITIGTKYQIDKFVNITKGLFKKIEK